MSWDIAEDLASSLSFDELDAVDVAALIQEDSEATNTKDLPLRFAVKRDFGIGTEDGGRWTTLSNGDRIWMLGVHSEGAKAISVTFDEFFIPEGAVLHLYNPDKTVYVGAYTNANNKTEGTFTTASIPGDQLIIEYYEPYLVRHEGELQVKSIAHSYRTLDETVEIEDPAFACLDNASCDDYSDAADKAASVVLITVDDGTRWCTGTLMNNANFDGKPYVLTGEHCLWGDPSTWTFTFRYESPECETNTAVRRIRAISGCSVVVRDVDASIALLELSARPLPSWNVFYAGWDASGATPQHVTSIHHPKGSVKKIVQSHQAPSIDVWKGVNVFKVESWDYGSTLDGSSGAPLFDEHGRMKGLLFGGNSDCDGGEDFYCQLSEAWGELNKHLNPFNQQVSFLNGTYLRFGEISQDVYQDDIAIFPNPASTSFNLLNDSDLPIESIRIYDASGRIVHEQSYDGQPIQTSSFPAGQYFIEVVFPNRLAQQKLLIWH